MLTYVKAKNILGMFKNCVRIPIYARGKLEVPYSWVENAGHTLEDAYVMNVHLTDSVLIAHE